MTSQYLRPTFQKTVLYWLKELMREVESKDLGPYDPDDLDRLDDILEEAKALVIAFRV